MYWYWYCCGGGARHQEFGFAPLACVRPAAIVLFAMPVRIRPATTIPRTEWSPLFHPTSDCYCCYCCCWREILAEPPNRSHHHCHPYSRKWKIQYQYQYQLMKPTLMSHWRAAVGSNNRASATKPQRADTRGSIVPWDLSGDADADAVAVADTTRDLDATTPYCWVCIPNTTAPTIRDAAVAGYRRRHADAQDHAQDHADSTHPSEPERAIAIDTLTECCGFPPLREFVN